MNFRKKSSWLKHLDFIFADLVILNITFYLAYLLRMGTLDKSISSNMYANESYRTLLITAVILHFCMSFFANHYSGILNRGYWQELKKVVLHNAFLFGLLLTYMFVTKVGEEYSRLLVVSFFCMNFIMMYLVHIILKKILWTRGVQESKRENILVVSNKNCVEESVKKLLDGPNKTFTIIGVALDEEDTEIKEVRGIPVVTYGKDTYKYACRNVVDSVLICLGPLEMENMITIAQKFTSMGVTVHIEMNLFSKEMTNISFGNINELNMMTTRINDPSTLGLFVKRVIDISAGLLGCLITGILFIFVAPAIKIADPKGPVFFGQERAGRNGRKFKIYKFRSMYTDAEERKKELMEHNKMDGLMFKLDADPRIIGSGPDGTKRGLGHFLRSSSIDEFPNFWSILKGDMSLVGTRPPTMDEYERYELHHKSRLAAKPGLTGMWQISGRSDMTDFEEIVKLDNEYIRKWNIGLDLKIIFKTVWVVLTRKGSQ